METKECVVCGKSFMPTNSRQIYCSKECKTEDYKAYGPPAKKKKKKPNNDLVDVAVKARKAGMTYGQYVAMEYLNSR